MSNPDEFVEFIEEGEGAEVLELPLEDGRVDVTDLCKRFSASCIDFKIVRDGQPRWRGLLAEKDSRYSRSKFNDGERIVIRAIRLPSAVLPIAPLSEPISEDVVNNIIDKFWELIRMLEHNLRSAKDFKASFSLTGRDICSIPNEKGEHRPNLLWEGLDKPFECSRYILEQQSETEPAVIILCDVSGAGKTRALYEIAMQRTCVFLTGTAVNSIDAEGSRDIYHVKITLERIFPSGEIPLKALTCCLRVILLVRFVLREKDECDNIAFLFKQVMHEHLRYPMLDPWWKLTEEILDLAKTPKELYELDNTVTVLLAKYMKWDVWFILDECQELVRYLPNRFRSGEGELNRSMMDYFALAMRATGFRKTICISGTGRSLYKVSTNLSETVKTRIPHMWVTNFGGFTDAESLKRYATRILKDSSVLDFDRLRTIYAGRHRAFTTALEHCIVKNPPDLTDWLMSFGMGLAKKRGLASSRVPDKVGAKNILRGVNRTILDDVYRYFEAVVSSEREAANLLVQSVVMNMFFGKGKIVVLNPTLSLVEFGLARLAYAREAEEEFRVQWICNGVDGIVGSADEIGHPHDGAEIRQVEIAEPLVLVALWTYYQEQSMIREIRQKHFLDVAELDASTRGKAYEAVVTEMVGRGLNNKVLAHYFASWNHDIPELYRKPAFLVEPTLDLKTPVAVETDDFRLLDWMRSVKEKHVGFKTYFSTAGNALCGPDMWFFLTIDRQLVICAVQVKTSMTMRNSDVVSAADSLNFDRLFLRKGMKTISNEKDAEAAKMVQEFPYYLKLIVTTDYVDIQKHSRGDAPTHTMKRRKFHQSQNQGLLGILDSSNIYMFVERWLLDSVRVCKEMQS